MDNPGPLPAGQPDRVAPEQVRRSLKAADPDLAALAERWPAPRFRRRAAGGDD